MKTLRRYVWPATLNRGILRVQNNARVTVTTDDGSDGPRPERKLLQLNLGDLVLLCGPRGPDDNAIYQVIALLERRWAAQVEARLGSVLDGTIRVMSAKKLSRTARRAA